MIFAIFPFDYLILPPFVSLKNKWEEPVPFKLGNTGSQHPAGSKMNGRGKGEVISTMKQNVAKGVRNFR